MPVSIHGKKAARLLGGATLASLGILIVGCAVNEMTPPAKAQAQAQAEAPARDSSTADFLPPARPVRAPRQDALGLRSSFADIVEPALESVVSIDTTKKRRVGRTQRGPLGIPFPFEGDEPSDSFGSGVVVRADGIILTNNHVVEGAEEVRVRFFDNREMRARVLGTDPLTDIAVLKVDATDLQALPMGTSSDLRVGDVVFAMGSPFALSQSATMGIISATGRSKIGITGNRGYEDFIQTDAPINPGNSGGALVDSRGEMIGINTAIFSSGSRGNQGIGFAVPVDMVRNILDQILREGKVIRAQLGVRIKEVDAALAKSFGLTRPMGAIVTSVEGGSPADRAGLKSEDLILELDGKSVTSDAQLRLDISSRAPGSRVTLAVLRDGERGFEKRNLEATLRALDAGEDDDEVRTGALEDSDNALRGIAVEDIAQIPLPDRRRLGIGDLATGVIVTDVDAFSPAARAGIRRGDLLTALNRQPVTGAAEFRAMAQNLGKSVVRVRVERGDSSDIVAVEP